MDRLLQTKKIENSGFSLPSTFNAYTNLKSLSMIIIVKNCVCPGHYDFSILVYKMYARFTIFI